MSKKADIRFPLRLDELTRWKIESWYERNDCGSRNEFVLKAVNFYADYLAGLENGILPAAIQSDTDGRRSLNRKSFAPSRTRSSKRRRTSS